MSEDIGKDDGKLMWKKRSIVARKQLDDEEDKGSFWHVKNFCYFWNMLIVIACTVPFITYFYLIIPHDAFYMWVRWFKHMKILFYMR